MAAPAPPDDGWGDLLLDGLPDVGFLDDLQLDLGLAAGLDDLDCLGLDLSPSVNAGGGTATHDPAGSDLLESLQLDAGAFDQPVGSSGARHSPSFSGSDSPVVLPLLGPAPPPAVAGAATATAGVQQSVLHTFGHGNGASPATSESENNGMARTASPAAVASQRMQASGSQGQQAQRPLTEEEKRLARMQRNRENAQLSRQRKKQQMTGLEQRCAVLQQQNAQLTGVVTRLTAENAALRQQLALVCQQAGRAPAAAAAAPSLAAAAAAGAAAQPPTPAGTAAAGAARPAGAAVPAAAAKGLLPQWPLLPFSFLPKVTYSVQPQAGAAQPAAPAAAAAARSQPPAAKPAAAAAAAAAGRAAKRPRTAAAGASTAFLALFTLFMFAGPLTPSPATTTAGSPAASGAASLAAAGAQRALQALPETPAIPAGGSSSLLLSSDDGGGGLHHSGRGLRALPAAPDDSSLDTLLAQQLPNPSALPQPMQLDAADGTHMRQLLNSTLQALLLEPGNAQLEAAALRRLQELGPVALLLDSDQGPGGHTGTNPLAASVAFPQLAGQLFGAAGLEVPQMCHKVLEFDAASVPHAARSRRSLERYVLGATGFRGRSLGAASGDTGPALRDGRPVQGPEPLRIQQPAIPGDEEYSDEEGHVISSADDGAGSTALMPAGMSSGPQLVSVLLPANASGGAKLTTIDKVFVVLLDPQNKYITYSCMLPRPVVL